MFQVNFWPKINFSKSCMVMLHENEKLGNMLTAIMQSKLKKFPVKYLGFPLTSTNLRIRDWIPLNNRFERKLDSQRGRLLSIGGRCVLVTSVLAALPSYYFSYFFVPKWVIKSIDKVRRNLLWKGKEKIGGGCLMKWNNIYNNKDQGGLGILNLRELNQALLGKWRWRLLTSFNLKWKRVCEV